MKFFIALMIILNYFPLYAQFKEGIFMYSENYNLIEKHKNNTYKIMTQHFMFFGNGTCFYNHGGIMDSIYYTTTRVKEIVLKNTKGASWGRFKFFKDTIKAHFRYQFYTRGMRTKYYDVHFEGVVKNKNEIIGWQMVKPYPSPNKSWNENFESLTIPKTLIFTPFVLKSLVDSNNVWIDEYDENYWKY